MTHMLPGKMIDRHFDPHFQDEKTQAASLNSLGYQRRKTVNTEMKKSGGPFLRPLIQAPRVRSILTPLSLSPTTSVLDTLISGPWT